MPPSMLTVREAHARVIAAFPALPGETVSVADAAGRVVHAFDVLVPDDGGRLRFHRSL